MEKDAWNWNACPELPPVMLISNHELARTIHKGMAIDYSRQSTERAKKNDIVKFGMCSVCMGNCIALEDTNGNRKLLKRRSDQKIDAVAAMMDAYIAWKLNREAFE